MNKETYDNVAAREAMSLVKFALLNDAPSYDALLRNLENPTNTANALAVFIWINLKDTPEAVATLDAMIAEFASLPM